MSISISSLVAKNGLNVSLTVDDGEFVGAEIIVITAFQGSVGVVEVTRTCGGRSVVAAVKGFTKAGSSVILDET